MGSVLIKKGASQSRPPLLLSHIKIQLTQMNVV